MNNTALNNLISELKHLDPNATVFDQLLRFYRGIVFNSDAKEIQFVRFPKYAETVWNISPEGYKNLRESLALSVAQGQTEHR